MANDKKVAPSITKMGGQGGAPGDYVHFYHSATKEFLPGIIKTIDITRYGIIWGERITDSGGNTTFNKYVTYVTKQQCIVYKKEH